MLPEQVQLRLAKDLIAHLPEEDRAKVEACAAKLREELEKAGDEGMLAINLVFLEAQFKVNQDLEKMKGLTNRLG